MDALIVFLRARLDERATRATAAATISRRDISAGFDWQVLDGGGMVALVGCAERWPDQLWDDESGSSVYHMTDEAAAHVADNDPRFVLADIAAKRAIIDEHVCPCPEPECGDCGACSGDHHADPTPSPCRTLRLLGIPFAGHPDYREEWKP